MHRHQRETVSEMHSKIQESARAQFNRRIRAFPVAAVMVLSGIVSAFAAEDAAQLARSGIEPDASVLRICAAAHEAPYSAHDGSGFENRIAEVLAQTMGRKVQFIWYDKPAIYLVRDQLNPKACDVVMGVDSGDDRVLTSKPYYRAPYVFIERSDSPLKITDWNSPDLMEAGKIGFAPGTPAEIMITKLGLYGKNFNYVKSLTNFKSPRNQYVRIDPSRMVNEVANGEADLAVGFAPEVSRYVRETDGKVKMVVIPDDNTRSDGQKVPFHFDQSIGVRKDDEKLLNEINSALAKAAPQVQAVLKAEGIPVLKPSGSAADASPPKS
jgi:mxaJ protein